MNNKPTRQFSALVATVGLSLFTFGCETQSSFSDLVKSKNFRDTTLVHDQPDLTSPDNSLEPPSGGSPSVVIPPPAGAPTKVPSSTPSSAPSVAPSPSASPSQAPIVKPTVAPSTLPSPTSSPKPAGAPDANQPGENDNHDSTDEHDGDDDGQGDQDSNKPGSQPSPSPKPSASPSVSPSPAPSPSPRIDAVAICHELIAARRGIQPFNDKPNYTVDGSKVIDGYMIGKISSTSKEESVLDVSAMSVEEIHVNHADLRANVGSIGTVESELGDVLIAGRLPSSSGNSRVMKIRVTKGDVYVCGINVGEIHVEHGNVYVVGADIKNSLNVGNDSHVYIYGGALKDARPHVKDENLHIDPTPVNLR